MYNQKEKGELDRTYYEKKKNIISRGYGGRTKGKRKKETEFSG